jgi:tetratricopeptide (TPR) repeat protein
MYVQIFGTYPAGLWRAPMSKKEKTAGEKRAAMSQRAIARREGDDGSTGHPHVPRAVVVRDALSQSEWEALAYDADKQLRERLANWPARDRFGISEISAAVGLTTQQIRLFERPMLVTPEFETSGGRQNRRYTKNEVLLIKIAALLMHHRHLKPAQAASLVLSWISGGRYSPRVEKDESASRIVDMQEAGLLNTAFTPLKSFIAARLVLIAASSLLGEQSLPANWCVCACPINTPVPEEQELHVEQFQGAELDGLFNLAERGVFAFVSPGGGISRIPVEFIRETRDSYSWHSIKLRDQRHNHIQVVFGVPSQESDSVAERDPRERLESGTIQSDDYTREVAASLFWVASKLISKVLDDVSLEIQERKIGLNELIARDGSAWIPLWLYARVLVEICPGIERCDILAPEPGGDDDDDLMLSLIASNDLTQLRTPIRASIRSMQLLSGFSYSLGQASFVEDVHAAQVPLISYVTQERTTSAAAIPVRYEQRSHACVYLCSSQRIAFDAVMQRVLQIAVNEVIEIFALYEMANNITRQSIQHVLRPYVPEEKEALRAMIDRWVKESMADDQPGVETDRRLVLIVVRGFPDESLRRDRTIIQWLDDAAFQAAHQLALALDMGVLSKKSNKSLFHSFSPTPIYRWTVTDGKNHPLPNEAFVIPVGTDLTWEHVQRAKDLVRKHKLDGRAAPLTEKSKKQPIGQIAAWVLDTKSAVIQRVGSPENRVNRIIDNINVCSRILLLLHLSSQVAFEEGNLAKGIEILREALDLAPNEPYILRCLMDMLISFDKPEEAVDLARPFRDDHGTLIREMPTKWDCALGRALLMCGNIDQAIAFARLGKEHDPSHHQPYRLLGEAYMAKGDYREAADSFRRAIACERDRTQPNEMRIIDTYILLADALERQASLPEMQHSPEREARLKEALRVYSGLRVGPYAKQAQANALISQRSTHLRFLLNDKEHWDVQRNKVPTRA